MPASLIPACTAATSNVLAASAPSTSPSSSTYVVRHPMLRWMRTCAIACTLSFGTTRANVRTPVG